MTDIGQPDLDDASDSGVLNSDNLTNDTTSFTFTGLTGVGATNDTLILFIDNTEWICQSNWKFFDSNRT